MDHGIHHGIQHGAIRGIRHGTSIFSTLTGFGLIAGQSNAEGHADFGSTNGSETGYGISDSVGYASAQMARQWVDAPADPYNLSSISTETLRAFAASGGINMGCEQTLARYFVNYGVAAAPILLTFAVGSTSLRRHWLANYPVGNTYYNNLVTWVRARQVEYGKPIEFLVWWQGETDAGDSTDAAQYQANLGTIFTNLRHDLSNPNLLIVVVQLNITSTGAFRDTVRAAQQAYVATDSNARLLSIDDVRLHSDPHYDALGQCGIGDMVASVIQKAKKPTLNTNLGTGPVPWWQQQDVVFPNINATVSSPRSGADSHDGDWELGWADSYSIATTHTWGTPAGFTQVVAPFASTFSGTVIRTLSVYERPVTAAILASTGRMPSPSITWGAATMNMAGIIGLRGPNKWSVSPIDVFAAGVNNANSTGLTLPSITTTQPNELIVMIVCTAGNTNNVASVVNAGLTNIVIRRDSRSNPGAGNIVTAVVTATRAAAGAIGATTVTFSGVGVNAGVILAIKP